MNKKKYNVGSVELIVSEMRRMEAEHPKAKVYYDWETDEIRITYPLPLDFHNFTKHPGKIT